MMAAATDVSIDSDRASQVLRFATKHGFIDLITCIRRGLFPTIRDNAFLFGRHFGIPEAHTWHEALETARLVMQTEWEAANIKED